MKKRRLAAQLFLFGFLLGIHNGRIALWKEPDPEPCRVFPYSAAALPSEVRDALQNGIRIESESDLNRLLENLLS